MHGKREGALFLQCRSITVNKKNSEEQRQTNDTNRAMSRKRLITRKHQWLKASDSICGSANKLKVKPAKKGKKHSNPIEKNETSLL